MEYTDNFSYKWYESLQIKIAAIFFILFFFIALAVLTILKTFGDKIIEDEAYLRLNIANNEVISELEKHTILSATLVNSIANVAQKLPNNDTLYRNLFPQLISHTGTESFIAGGGVWPAAYQFNKDNEKNSFFWARNQFGELKFYDDYNKPLGDGYHHEEWYIPATHLSEGDKYWSKSYTDPYSLQTMVTVSAPIFKNEENVGVATIDIELQGLQTLFKKISRPFNGYAFAVDRNGTFLSYPDLQRVISSKKNREGHELKSFINYQELAVKYPEFETYSNILNQQRNNLLENLDHDDQFGENLATTLALESYQISKEEAGLIVASILHAQSNTISTLPKRTNLFLKDDPLLNEPVFVSITMMPETYWKIITVMPYSHGVEKISDTYQNLIASTLIALLLTIIIIWLCIRYIVTTPISNLAKQVQSQIENKNQELQIFNTPFKGELNTLVAILNQHTSQLMNNNKKIEKLAHFDFLTGLPNRRLMINRLNDKLASCDRQQCCGALLFIDIDNFKHINDSLGHAMGDELLLRVAERFNACVRREDTLARLGGDEFVILIMKSQSYSRKLTHESTVLAQKLLLAMNEPITLQGHIHHMTISIGITTFENEDSSSDELLRQADTAMYRAKDVGKNGFCFFNSHMQEIAHRRLDIEEALRIALDKKELFLVYQPQVNTQGDCIGVEALVRWTHPVQGVLTPAEFISIAEESGLILELGTWVLDESCAQFKRWTEDNIHLEKISINVSPKQFRHINFINTVRDTLSKYQLPAHQLTLEITEGVVIEDIKDTINKMTILKSLGVAISIDDFGTGYSSLTYLKELPIDQLKIDQSFVSDIINDKKGLMIASTIIAISKKLGLNVIAEGVENKQQVELLNKQGCDRFQGFYFSKPMLADEFSRYVQSKTISNVQSIGAKT